MGIQKDFALWAVESWAMALNIVSSPLPQKHDENSSNSSLTLSNPPINISFTQKNIGKFIVQNEIAIDLQMKLMWLRFAYGQRWLDGKLIGSSKKVNWENAMKIPEFFNQQNYLGYNDWRLPNIYELKTLIDMENGQKTGYFTDANVFQYLNPYAAATEIINDKTVNNSFASFIADLEVAKGLTVSGFGSWRKLDENTGNYTPAKSTLAYAIEKSGIASINNRHEDEKLMDISLTYKSI